VTLRINRLIKTTKTELAEAERAFRRMSKVEMNDMINDGSNESCDQLRRREKCLMDARQYILDREIELTASRLHDTPLLAIHDLIVETKGASNAGIPRHA
jgi:hypothetical protein